MRTRTLSELLRDTHVGAIIIAQLIAASLRTTLLAVRHLLLWIIISAVKWIVVYGRFDEVAPIPGVHTYPIQLAQWLLLVPVFLAFAYLLAAWVYRPRERTHPRY